MKKVFVFISALMFTLCLSAQQYNDSTWTIGNGYIGKIAINMDVARLTDVFASQQIVKKDFNEHSKISISDKDGSHLMFELETMCMDMCIISRMYCYSDKFKTSKGIGVGNTVGELKKYYTISAIMGGEKGIMIYIDEMPQMAFIPKVPKLKSFPDKVYKTSEIPDESLIEIIYMY